jgi:hypothetical protein
LTIRQTINISEAILIYPMFVPVRSATNETVWLAKHQSADLSRVFANLAVAKIPAIHAVDGVLCDEHAQLIASYGTNIDVIQYLPNLRHKIADAS